MAGGKNERDIVGGIVIVDRFTKLIFDQEATLEETEVILIWMIRPGQVLL